MSSELKKIGHFKKAYNDILSAEFPLFPIFKSDGLKKHIEKRHPKCVSYIDRIDEILTTPDYIGMKDEKSVELIKIYDDNILLALQLDKTKNYFYVASLYDISSAKLSNRLHSGRIKTTWYHKRTDK